MNYENKKVTELKEELKARGLPVTGTKNLLIQRLEEHDRSKSGVPKSSPALPTNVTLSYITPPKPVQPPQKKQKRPALSLFESLLEEMKSIADYNTLPPPMKYNPQAKQAEMDKALFRMSDQLRKSTIACGNKRITDMEHQQMIEEYNKGLTAIANEFHRELNDSGINILRTFGYPPAAFIETNNPHLGVREMRKYLKAKGLELTPAREYMSTIGNTYSKSFRPSPHTSLLIRTTADYSVHDLNTLVSPLLHIDEANKLTALYEGRAEVVCHYHHTATAMSLAGNDMALATRGGMSDRSPVLSLFELELPEKDRESEFDLGFSQFGWALHIDEEHNLVWNSTGDKRIKAFKIRGEKGGHLWHTLKTNESVKDLIVVGDTLYAAGDRKIYKWDISKLAIHEKPCLLTDKSKEHAIGGEMPTDFMYFSEDDDEIEVSKGEVAHETVEVPYSVLSWAKLYSTLPGSTNNNNNNNNNSTNKNSSNITHLVIIEEREYCVKLLDLNNLRNPTVLFVGHPSPISSIITSPSHPYIMTSSDDCCVRLFKIGDPLPNLILSVGRSPVDAITSTTINGNVFVFSGTREGELKCWDITNRKCIYELSTGNCSVSFLQFHDGTQTLFAAIERHDYDQVSFLSDPRYGKGKEEEFVEEEDLIGHNGKEVKWPLHALYNPKYFGHTWDLERPGLLEYNFKLAANIEVVPKN